MKKGEFRKAEILAAAQRLFFAHGYRHVSIADILADMGCTKGCFYHHFNSKYQVLEELIQTRVQAWRQGYGAQQADDLLQQFNALLYFSQPLRRGEEEFLGVLVGLAYQQEAADIIQRLRQALSAAFYPHYLFLLEGLRAQQTAFVQLSALPQLLWENHLDFCRLLLEEGCRQRREPGVQASALRPLLRAACFLWERSLDLPYGSMEYIPLDEAAAALHMAAQAAGGGEEQLRFAGLEGM